MHLKGQESQIGFTIEIKRAETGEVETYELIGKVISDGSDTSSGGSASGD